MHMFFYCCIILLNSISQQEFIIIRQWKFRGSVVTAFIKVKISLPFVDHFLDNIKPEGAFGWKGFYQFRLNYAICQLSGVLQNSVFILLIGFPQFLNHFHPLLFFEISSSKNGSSVW